MRINVRLAGTRRRADSRPAANASESVVATLAVLAAKPEAPGSRASFELRSSTTPPVRSGAGRTDDQAIGGKAPSAYLKQIQAHVQVQLSDAAMNEIVASHLVDPALLRADAFEAFYAARKLALLEVIARAMGKPLSEASEAVADDGDDEDDEDDANAA